MKLHYVPSITFGNILTSLGMLGAILSLWVNLNVRLTKLEMRQEWINTGLRKNEDMLNRSIETQNELTRQAVRLTAVIDLLEKRK